VHQRVNIPQYVKQPSGRWQWAPIPRNRRTGAYVWAKALSTNFCIVWREQNRRRYEKAGSTLAEALEAKRRKEFELLGRAAAGEKGRRMNPREPGMSAEAAVADYPPAFGTGHAFECPAPKTQRNRIPIVYRSIARTPAANPEICGGAGAVAGPLVPAQVSQDFCHPGALLHALLP
jgi:hypothetical protein